MKLPIISLLFMLSLYAFGNENIKWESNKNCEAKTLFQIIPFKHQIMFLQFKYINNNKKYCIARFFYESYILSVSKIVLFQ